MGSRCKVLRRHFEGGDSSDGDPGGGDNPLSGGWAWLPSVPTCAQIHISLEVLTTAEDATLLFSGSQEVERVLGSPQELKEPSVSAIIVDRTHADSPAVKRAARRDTTIDEGINGATHGDGTIQRNTSESKIPKNEDQRFVIEKSSVAKDTSHGSGEIPDSENEGSDVMILQLRQGRPYLLMDLGNGAVSLALNASYSLADNTWHRIDLIWKDQVRKCMNTTLYCNRNIDYRYIHSDKMCR